MSGLEKRSIGFNRRVDLQWLEFTASRVMAGIDPTEIYRELVDFLSFRLSVGSNAKRGSREKTITLLKRTWVTPSPELTGLRDSGITLLKKLPVDQHLAVHWCMTMAAYPFWKDVAAVTGRLLRLQENVSGREVQRRIREQYGQREMAYRSARYVISAFLQWGAIVATDIKGIYEAASPVVVHDHELQAWMCEAYLHTMARERFLLNEFSQDPAMFPFLIHGLTEGVIQINPRLTVSYQGVDQQVVMLS